MICESSLAMRCGDSTKSTHPARRALVGIPSNFAVFGSCAKVIPPAAWIAFRPSVPSEAVPDKTTPMARCP